MTDRNARTQAYMDAAIGIQIFGVGLLAAIWYAGSLALAELVSPFPLPAVGVTAPPIVVSGFLVGNVVLLVVALETSPTDTTDS